MEPLSRAGVRPHVVHDPGQLLPGGEDEVLGGVDWAPGLAGGGQRAAVTGGLAETRKQET